MADEKKEETTEETVEQTIRDSVTAAFDENQKEDKERAAIGEEDNPAEIAPEKAAEDAGEAKEEPAEESVEKPAEGDGGLIAPENWDADRTAAFDGLTDEATKQEFLNAVTNLEKGVQRQRTADADIRKEHEAISALMQPFEAQLGVQGLDRVGGIRQLVAAQNMLTQNPAQGIAQLVQQFGGQNAAAIVQQLAQLYGVTPAVQDDQAYVDPQFKALNGRVDQLTNVIQQTQTNADATRVAEAQNQIGLFKNATDDDGNSLHPHFESVEALMSSFITGGHAADMQTAYDQAIYANPELRKGLLETERTAVADKMNDTRKAEVAVSKKASKNVRTTNTPPEVEPDEPASIRDSVTKAYDEAAS